MHSSESNQQSQTDVCRARYVAHTTHVKMRQVVRMCPVWAEPLTVLHAYRTVPGTSVTCQVVNWRGWITFHTVLEFVWQNISHVTDFDVRSVSNFARVGFWLAKNAIQSPLRNWHGVPFEAYWKTCIWKCDFPDRLRWVIKQRTEAWSDLMGEERHREPATEN
jgi:hypothetical protein